MLHNYILHMNRVKNTETAIFFPLMCFLLPEDLHSELISSKVYGKRDDFDFNIVNFPFSDDDFLRNTSCGVYMS